MKNKIFLLFFIFSFIYSKQSLSMSYDSRYFYCNRRIYCDNNGLTQEEINSLCTKISSDDRYVILLTNKDRFSDERSYSLNSEDFFSNNCLSNKYDCRYDFAISIYLWGGKVIITAGQNSKNIVKQDQRMRIINNMISYLKNGEYYTALANALTDLTKFYYQNGGSRSTSTNRNNGHSTFVVFFFIIICLCCCVLGYFIYQNQKKSNEELTYTQITDTQDIYNTNNSFDQSLKIHNHLVALEKIIEEIRSSNPPIKETNQCLICMQQIINTVGTSEIGNTRFACQHIYHTDCLSRYNLNSCLMCKDTTDNASNRIQNLHDSQVLSEENVKNFIKNIQNIYPPKELRIYSQRYPQEYNNFNDGLMLGLLASSWCMPPPVMIINNNGNGYGMGYNEYGYNNNNYNPPPNYYDGNPNPDSAVGGFQNNNNIEMTDFNNNNNGGNFGGFGNNNSNDGGNFGGGDFDTGGDF